MYSELAHQDKRSDQIILHIQARLLFCKVRTAGATFISLPTFDFIPTTETRIISRFTMLVVRRPGLQSSRLTRLLRLAIGRFLCVKMDGANGLTKAGPCMSSITIRQANRVAMATMAFGIYLSREKAVLDSLHDQTVCIEDSRDPNRGFTTFFIEFSYSEKYKLIARY